MLWVLLIKDLKRTRANPWVYLLFLALPMIITGMIGLTFGPSARTGQRERIKVAIVDEDDSALGQFIRSPMNEGAAKERIDVRFIDREQILPQIRDEGVSAALIIPKDFTERFLTGGEIPPIEVVKNPAQSFYPTIVEEMTAVIAEGLSAISRLMGEELAEVIPIFDTGERPDTLAMANLITQVGRKFEVAEDYLFPPLVVYRKQIKEQAQVEEGVGSSNLFAYLLPSLAAMFLLFIADGAIRDIYRELRIGTLDRFRTLHRSVFPVILSKIALGLVLLLLSSAIIFIGGSLIFQFTWERPLPMTLVVLAYCFFAAAFLAFLAALARSEKRADVMNNIIVMLLSFLGGSFFQVEALPPFLRDYITPWLPNYWFADALRGLQFGWETISWVGACLRLMAAGAALVCFATWMLNRVLRQGVRE